MKNEIEELREMIGNLTDEGWRKIYMGFIPAIEKGIDGIETDTLIAQLRYLVSTHEVSEDARRPRIRGKRKNQGN